MTQADHDGSRDGGAYGSAETAEGWRRGVSGAMEYLG
jgi:hypothetical protein